MVVLAWLEMGDIGWGNLLQKFAPAEGSWKCEACMVMNPPEATMECESCGTPKPGSGKAEGTAGGISSNGFTFSATPAAGAGAGASTGAAPSFGFGFGAAGAATAPAGATATFGFAVAPAPAANGGGATAAAAASKKRLRLDGQVSKEEYDAVDAAGGSGTPGQFRRADTSALARRKQLVPKKQDKDAKLAGMLGALNSAFAKNVGRLMSKHPSVSWGAAISDYLMYVEQLEQKYGGRAGQLLTFGSGDCGQLAHAADLCECDETDVNVPVPRLVDALKGLAVASICCGGLHNAVVTTEGRVFTWGCNDDAALGRAGPENMPAVVDGLPAGEVIVQVVAGDCFTAALSVSGDVFAWGCYKDSEGKQFCHAADASGCVKQKQPRATLIEGIDRVAEIAGGENFCAARCENGQVFTWGLNMRGELGRPTGEPRNAATKEYDADLIFNELLWPAPPVLADGSPVRGAKTIGCGGFHLLITTVDSRGCHVYGSGLNNYGQLGVGVSDEDGRPQDSKSLIPVPLLEDVPIVAFAAGQHHSLALSSAGQIWAWGRGDCGQLGIKDKPESGFCVETPQKVPLEDVAAISCGSAHCLVLTRDNDIYTWGYGDGNALGHGKERDENRPTKLNLTVGGGQKVLQLGGGGQHSAILLAKQ